MSRRDTFAPSSSIMNLDLFTLPASLFGARPKARLGDPVSPKANQRFCEGEFLRGPIPLSWLSRAAKIPGKTIHVALAVWFEYGRRNKAEFRLTTAILERFGVGRKALYAAIKALEEEGLIAVTRQHGKNPVVRLLLLD